MAPNPTPEKVEKERGHQITSPSVFLHKSCGAIHGLGDRFAEKEGWISVCPIKRQLTDFKPKIS